MPLQRSRAGWEAAASGWEVGIATGALGIKAGELGGDLLWRSTKDRDRAGLQNDPAGSAAPAPALWGWFAPFQAGEDVRDPNPPGTRLTEPRSSGKGSWQGTE